jgi:hypothetical protein
MFRANSRRGIDPVTNQACVSAIAVQEDVNDAQVDMELMDYKRSPDHHGSVSHHRRAMECFLQKARMDGCCHLEPGL